MITTRILLTSAILTGSAFAQTWNGTVSSDWNTAANWSTGAVPTNAGNVIISSNGSNAPQVISANAVANVLSVSATTQFRVQNGYALSTNRAYLGYGFTTTALAVDGIGSNWSSASEIYVGYTFGADASVLVTNGATVNAGGITVLGEGGTTSSNATITINGSGSQWTNTGALTIGGNYRGTLQLTAGGSLTTSGASIGLYNLSNFASTANLSGASTWNNTGALTVGGAGKGTLSIADTSTVQSSGLVTIANTATANATITMTGGALAANGGLTFGNGTSAFNLNGGTLRVGGNNGIQSAGGAYAFNWGGGSIQATGSNLVTSINATLTNATTTTIDTTSYNATFSGLLSGAGALRKTGAGTLTLSGANTYSGGTTIEAGTLTLAGNYATGSGSLFIDSAATLAGSGIISGATTVAGAIAPGSNLTTLTFTNDLTLTGSSLTLLDIGGASLYDQIYVGGLLTTGGTLQVSFVEGYAPTSGATFHLFNSPNPISGTFAGLSLATLGTGLSWDMSALYSTGILSVTTSAIPEPSTYALFVAVAAMGLALIHRRKNRFHA